MRVRYWLFLFFINLCFIDIKAQNSQEILGLNPNKAISQYRLDSWQREQGLPQNSIFSILQSSDGFLWITTYEGIARFDGISFEIMFNEANYTVGLQGAWDLYEDSQKNIWIGTHGSGIILYKSGKTTIFNKKNGLPSNDVFTIAEDKQGRIWYGTREGLGYYHQGKFKNFTKKDGLLSNYITRIFVDKKGRVWVGTDRGIHLIEGNKIINYTRNILFFNKAITAIAQASNGDLWIGTPTGLIRWNPDKQTQKRYEVKDGLSNDYITSLYVDTNNALWIGTQSGGLNRFYKNRFTALTVKNGLTANSVTAIFQDREGNLWIGLNRGGLMRLSDGKFVVYNVEEGLTDRVANCIFEDKEGGLWIGTTSGGVSHFKAGKFTNYTTNEGLSDNYVRSITEDSQGNIWIATYGGGLNKLNNGKITTYTEKDGLSSNVIRAVIEASNGDLWIATKNGLSRYNEGKFTNYTIAEGLSDNSIIALYEDRRQRLWIGTEGGGVNLLYPDGKIEHYGQSEGLADDLVFSFFEDGAYIWVGTKGGLSRIYQGKVISILAKDGLPNPSIQSLTEDQNNRLWMSCNSGIFWIEKQELYEFCDGKRTQVSSTLYNESDGLKSADCAASATPSVCKDRNGNLWYPTTEGIAMIDPLNIRTNTLPPLVVINKVIADNLVYDTYEPLTFSAGTSKFEFDYSGLSFTAPDQVQFRYKLEGFDKDWVEAKKRRDAYYTNLNPGEYTFKVMAMNNDGVWSEVPASVTFYIKPFFFQTSWFYLFVFLAFASSGAGIYFWRIKNLELAKAKLQQGIEDQTRQIKKQYQEITRQAQELEVLDNIVQTINQEVTLENVLEAILTQGLILFNQAEKAIFLMYDPLKKQFYLIRSKGYSSDFQLSPIDYNRAVRYCEQGRKHSDGFYLISPKDSKNKIAEHYQPAASLAMLIEIKNVIRGILLFDNQEKSLEIQPQDSNKLRRFREHALSAFSRAMTLKQLETKTLEIERSLKKMADSIRYAKRIQNAIFVQPKEIINAFPEAFIFYRPKDIVSGDFYWYAETIPEPVYDVEQTEEGTQSVFKGFSDTFKVLAAVDCTGHGVPGALMTVVGNDLLDAIVKQKQAYKPSQILRQMDLGVKTYLKQEEGSQTHDGMDMAVIVIDETKQEVNFAGAKNPLIHIRKGKLTVYNGAKFPIGGIQIKRKIFQTTVIPYEEGDIFYLFSDGFQDQFGGENGERKYGPKRFRELLLNISEKTLQEQHQILEQEFVTWRGEYKQTDDVLVIGVKL